MVNEEQELIDLLEYADLVNEFPFAPQGIKIRACVALPFPGSPAAHLPMDGTAAHLRGASGDCNSGCAASNSQRR